MLQWQRDFFSWFYPAFLSSVVFCVPSFSFLWSSDFCQKGGKSVKHLSVKNSNSCLCCCREVFFSKYRVIHSYCIPEKEKPDFRKSCHSRFLGTPYDSCKIISGGRETAGMCWEGSENWHTESVCGLL